MKKSGFAFLILLLTFILTESLPAEEGSAWKNIDLNYKPPKDTVAWDNIDLVDKPAAPKSQEKEWPAEEAGLTGTIVTYGRDGREDGIAVYDPSGAPILFITREQAKKSPDMAEAALNIACSDQSSQSYNGILQKDGAQGDDPVLAVDRIQKMITSERFGLGWGSMYGSDSAALDVVDSGTHREGNLFKETDDEIVVPRPLRTGFDTYIRDKAAGPTGGAHHDIVYGFRMSPSVAIEQAPFTDRVRLNFDTSFTGEDRLRTRLEQSETFTSYAVDTDASFADRAFIQPDQSIQGPGIPAGFAPRVSLMYDVGARPGDIMSVNREIIRNFTRGAGDRIFDDLSGQPGVYIIQIVHVRIVQDTLPDDPLYMKDSGKKKSSGGGGLSLGGFFGSGGGGIGLSAGGSSSDDGPKDQWGIREAGYKPYTDTSSAWNVEQGKDKNVIVAVIDSGLDTEHPDGPEYLWINEDEMPGNGLDDDHNGYVDDVNGWNFLNENNDLTDTKGHGTFVAGIIAAKRDNGIGIAGINPGARIMVLKAADENGNAASLNIYRAIRYAVDNGARVINISLGEKGLSKLEQLAINYAYRKGALVVAASGNQAGDIAAYGPAACIRAFVVGAMNTEGTRSIIMNRGQNLALIAPGEDIYSLHSKDAEWDGPAFDKERMYLSKSGTSFSAPIVSATASLMLAADPDLTNEDLADILMATAGRMGEHEWDADHGAGSLRAYDALKAENRSYHIARITEVVEVKEGRRIEYMDVYGVVRGEGLTWRLEVGKGDTPSRWETVGLPHTENVDYGLLGRVDGKQLSRRGNVIRVVCEKSDGTSFAAYLPTDLED